MATAGIFMAGLMGLAAYMAGPSTYGVLTKIGAFRQLKSTPLANPEDLVVIKDTTHCEDIHYYAPAHTLFTACEDVSATRFQWFPPLAFYDDANVAWNSRGSIHTIDPETKQSKRLTFENFDGPFITHGIDVVSDPDPARAEDDGAAVYILAVNHVPNQAVFPRDGSTPETDPGTAPKAASRIEVFHHVLGSGSVRHVRTIAHPLVKTPNDIYAVSPSELYVTNDHHYFEGHLRSLEDLWPGATWSNVIHVTVDEDGKAEADVALDKLHNPNGMGHGRSGDEVLVTSAIGGTMWIGKLGPGAKTVAVQETVDLDSTIDNPSYYSDPYADRASGDASGFILPGLTRGIDMNKVGKDPLGKEGTIVWYVTPSKNVTGTWDKRLLWEDDGTMIRNAAGAVLVGIDPKKEGGKKAWLYVTGFSSENTVAVKVDLS